MRLKPSVKGHMNPAYGHAGHHHSKPNKPDKGLEGGSCNRTACQLELSAFCYNRVMDAWYCIRCARAINEGGSQFATDLPLVNIPADYHDKWEAAVLADDEKNSQK